MIQLRLLASGKRLGAGPLLVVALLAGVDLAVLGALVALGLPLG